MHEKRENYCREIKRYTIKQKDIKLHVRAREPWWLEGLKLGAYSTSLREEGTGVGGHRAQQCLVCEVREGHFIMTVMGATVEVHMWQ